MADSLLNTDRPAVFCPGCSHERVTRALDAAYAGLGLAGRDIAMISDIGCSGLFDTFFHTHALHGLHGRALTYAVGLKLMQPGLNVVVSMGDGGLGIGGAHLLSACRRNLNLTLLILNNFNFGMTGGQFSATTPSGARVGSGFLNRLEHPMDAATVAAAAGAPFVTRCSAYDPDLAERIGEAIAYDGFALVDIWGACTGRYTRSNRLTPATVDHSLAELPPRRGEVAANRRREYGAHYRELAAGQPAAVPPAAVAPRFTPPATGRREILLLGDAGQRAITAGELVCLAGMTAGLQATQKNDYNITVLRGPSISEVILAAEPIGYTGSRRPDAVLAVGPAGIARRREVFARLDPGCTVVRAAHMTLPDTPARVDTVDVKALKVKSADVALAGLAVLAARQIVISLPMLYAAIRLRFAEPVRGRALELVERVAGAVG